ncbi:hypothetical protein PSTT_05231 [Puccinia striiformis]|uniref:Uncharacterized protein n=1 Tax=Puccinia striiformis TaxID=27350 RepID=A0A2S4VPJ2_9BASI|nr:hypothetical protein PSTT_05231 [Puccinia striiformis]
MRICSLGQRRQGFFGLHLPAFNSTRSNISAKMNTTLYALLSLAVATLSVGAVGQTNQCQFYASVGVKGYSASPFETYIHCDRRMLTKSSHVACNERPDIICSEGCKSFVTMTGCVLTQYPKKPATTELCTVGYGRDTAAFKACLTSQGAFRCNGTSTGQATCSGCVPRGDVTWAN